MRRRSLLVALGAAVGAVALVRRRQALAPRVTVHYGDGRTVSLAPGLPQTERLLAAAREALAAAAAST